jgi:hypothetical protein
MSDLTLHPWATWSQAKLLLTARYSGHDIPHPGVVLNEARLSAIAISIYLAALKVETPEAAGQTIAFPGCLSLTTCLSVLTWQTGSLP